MSALVWFVFSAGGLAVFFAVCALWMLLGWRARAARVVSVAGASFYLFASVPAVPELVSWPLLAGFRPLRPTDVGTGRTAIVVLGSGSVSVRDWQGTRFSTTDPIASSRVLEATRVDRLLPAAIVISSGGNTRADDTRVPTGESMGQVLRQLGVPAERLVVETTSRNTRDEALLVAAILAEHRIEHAVLVTSDVHMRRSLGAFKAVGVQALPAIARSPLADAPAIARWIPGDRGLSYSGLVAHEYLGIGYYAARGWFVR